MPIRILCSCGTTSPRRSRSTKGGPVVLLEDVILSGRYRNWGPGRRLVEHVMDWARGEGFLRVTLLTDGDNHGARRFYERLGFGSSDMVVYRRRFGEPQS